MLHRVTLHILVLLSPSQQYSAVSSHLKLFSLALGAEEEITVLTQPQSPTCTMFLGVWAVALSFFYPSFCCRGGLSWEPVPPQGVELCCFSCSLPFHTAVSFHLCPDSSHSCPSFTRFFFHSDERRGGFRWNSLPFLCGYWSSSPSSGPQWTLSSPV